MVARLVNGFDAAGREAVYRAIYTRRDVRSHFRPDAIPRDLLMRVLDAAHHAPSVGFMQPWRFIVVENRTQRAAIRKSFERANDDAARTYEGDRLALYRSLKLEAILEAPLNICVVCDQTSNRGHGLGRQTIPETAIYSTVCAVQNLWLAARAEGLGVGWVSIVEPAVIREVLGIPAQVTLVAYLCIGFVSGFDDAPALEQRGWEERAALADVVYFERFGTCAVEPPGGRVP